jgi:predicted NBD/HSP70 family sugar kinase
VPALLDILRPALGDVTLRDVLELTRTGNAGCRRVITDAGAMIGMAVGSLCNLVNPERVVVGGDLAAAGEVLLDGLRAGLARAAIPPAADIEVVTGVLGERAEVLGAVALALRESGLGFAHASHPAQAA